VDSAPAARHLVRQMWIDAKLREWQGAGLIDQAIADRLRAHERSRADPPASAGAMVLWAALGLGATALLLGLALLVASRWDSLSDAVKLGGVGLLLLGAAAVAERLRSSRSAWLADGALLLFSGVVLGGVALLTALYQLRADAWRILLAELLLISPLWFVAARTRPAGWLWAVLLNGTLALLAFDHRADGGPWLLVHGAWMAGPAVLVALAYSGLGAHRAFAEGLADAGLAGVLVGASLAHFAWAQPVTGAEATDWAIRLVLPAVAASGAAYFAVRAGAIAPGLAAALALAPLLSIAAALSVPHGEGWGPRLVGFLIYCAMWGWIGRAAAVADVRGLFAIAVAAVAVRLFIVYVELFGSLAATGLGLAGGGVLLIGLGLAWVRLTGRPRQ